MNPTREELESVEWWDKNAPLYAEAFVFEGYHSEGSFMRWLGASGYLWTREWSRLQAPSSLTEYLMGDAVTYLRPNYVKLKNTSPTNSSRVLKFQLPIKEDFKLTLPEDIKVIRVDNQEGLVYLWGVCSSEETKEFSFKASKTGGDLGDLTGYDYVGFGYVVVQMELGLYYFMKEG